MENMVLYTYIRGMETNKMKFKVEDSKGNVLHEEITKEDFIERYFTWEEGMDGMIEGLYDYWIWDEGPASYSNYCVSVVR